MIYWLVVLSLVVAAIVWYEYVSHKISVHNKKEFEKLNNEYLRLGRLVLELKADISSLYKVMK